MNIEEKWYNFKYGVQNLIKWFRIIWNDRDWDYSFIYTILKFKLINQAKHTAKLNKHESSKREVEIMNLCVKLIQRCQDEYYDDEWYDKRDFSKVILKYPLQYKKVILANPKLIGNDIRIAMQICSNNQQRCRRLLFNLLERNIEKWWN